MSTQLTVKSLLATDSVKSRFTEILKERAAGFTANLAVMVNNSEALKKCDPVSVISAAVVSASLDLPLDPNLGFAAVVPYGTKAQFQIMYKGLVQLAIRSGQYKTMNVSEVYEGELIDYDRITGYYKFDWRAKTSDKVIGYAAYFDLINGFSKNVYWTIEQIDRHAKRFSQTYKKGYGLWKDDFDSMAKKTVLKNLISKWGVLSIEMQKSLKFDQAVVTETEEAEYIDAPENRSFDESEVITAIRTENND